MKHFWTYSLVMISCLAAFPGVGSADTDASGLPMKGTIGQVCRSAKGDIVSIRAYTNPFEAIGEQALSQDPSAADHHDQAYCEVEVITSELLDAYHAPGHEPDSK
jgi:hypothetical protein